MSLLCFVSLNWVPSLCLTRFLWPEDYLFSLVYSWICEPGRDMEEGIILRQKNIVRSMSLKHDLLWKMGGKLNKIWRTVGKWGIDLGFITLSSTKLPH